MSFKGWLRSFVEAAGAPEKKRKAGPRLTKSSRPHLISNIHLWSCATGRTMQLRGADYPPGIDFTSTDFIHFAFVRDTRIMRVMYTVIETPTFQKQAEKIWSESERIEFINWIAENALVGDVIPGAQGARKVRWSVAVEASAAECVWCIST
jgi:hypothetical protein